MKRSDQINELAGALAKAQSKIRAAEKDRTNPHFGQSYATLASSWDTARAPLTENGLSVAQVVDTTDEGIFLTTLLLHSSGQFLESFVEVRPTQNTPQGIGSALTYMRRYSFQAIVGVAQGDDDDGNEASKGQPLPPKQQKSKQPEAPIAPNDGLFRASFGKYRGKTMQEAMAMDGPEELRNYVQYLEDTAIKEGKPITPGGPVEIFIKNAIEAIADFEKTKMQPLSGENPDGNF